MRKLLLTLSAIAAISIVALLPASAAAETPSGRPLVTVPIGAKGKGLRAGGARVQAFGGGLVRNNSVALIVSDITIVGADRVNLVLRGGIKIKRRGRTLTVRGFYVKVAGRKLSVTARVGRKRVTLLTGKLSASKIDAARIAIEFSARRTALSKSAVKAIRSKLRSFRPRSRSLGRIGGTAFVMAPPQTGAVVSANEAYSCKPVAGSATDSARPATAVDITCGYVVFHARDSWTTYIEYNTPILPAAGLPAISGTDHVCKDSGTNQVDVFSYSLPVQSGWWDAASGTGHFWTVGGMHYVSDTRPINFYLKDLEIVIDGVNSKTFMVATESDDPTPKRIPFATINPAAPLAGAAPGPGVALSRLRQIMTVESQGGPFGWYYASPGSGFGCIDFGFSF